jgi:hypothetical protein
MTRQRGALTERLSVQINATGFSSTASPNGAWARASERQTASVSKCGPFLDVEVEAGEPVILWWLYDHTPPSALNCCVATTGL